MWWSDRRAVLIAAGALALAGCGFTPVYAPGGGAGRLQGQIALPAAETRDEFELRRRLEERLGAAAAGRDGRTTRFQLVGRADYTLSDAATGDELASGRVDGFTGYSTTGSTVATDAARRDAETRLMVLLADGIVDRLLLAAAELP